jgi:7,8-dihydropterin-6-yl-methyl-4-(beta-D-ribofuranosyl)aminobenzene 5'-phosphate synthase
VVQPRGKSMLLTGEHGLAMLIKITNKAGELDTILFDTGGIRNTILDNSRFLKEDLGEVDKLIISHGHYDHHGSLMKVIPKLKQGCEIYINPLCFAQNHIINLKNDEKVPLRQFSKHLEELNDQKKVLFNAKLPILNKAQLYDLADTSKVKIKEIKEPFRLLEGVITSGEIDLADPDEITKNFYLVDEEKDQATEHTFRDETALYMIVAGSGLIVITGCGHSGIMNTIKHGQQLTGIDKIFAVIGGFHEDWSTDLRIQNQVDKFELLNPKIVCGMHCTGFRFNARMAHAEYHTLGVVGTEFLL